MTTVTQLAKASLHRILVEGADSPLEPDEYQDYMDSLNWYMAALESEGIKLGFTTVSNLSDEVTIPPGAIRGVVANMAIEVAPDYGGLVTPELVSQASKGMDAMLILGVKIIPTQMPDTLPRGAGNTQVYDSNYYDAEEYATLTMAGNTNATENAALNTPTKVHGQWSLGKVVGLSADVSGRVGNITAGTVDAQVTITLDATCATSDTFTFYLARNGTATAASGVSAALSTTSTQVTLTYLQSLSPNDYLELFVEADTTAVDMTVVNSQFKVV